MSMLAVCEDGCYKQFYVNDFKTGKLPGNIEKVYYNCTHCEHEYVAFYTDLETRKLQEKMRKLHKRYAQSNAEYVKLNKQEKKLKKQIEGKMEAVRKKVEG